MSKVVHLKIYEPDVLCMFRVKPRSFLATTIYKEEVTCKRCLAKLKKEKSK